ncbi:unnamed protein product [Adineta ricciae]|uniref:Uncharacterized protein n=1 Tax=Adineta ricciae TaxID=249248 RepID=A0A814F6C0_ADIRI|nr:unnamed protein product [Adineta ricciae]
MQTQYIVFFITCCTLATYGQRLLDASADGFNNLDEQMNAHEESKPVEEKPFHKPPKRGHRHGRPQSASLRDMDDLPKGPSEDMGFGDMGPLMKVPGVSIERVNYRTIDRIQVKRNLKEFDDESEGSSEESEEEEDKEKKRKRKAKGREEKQRRKEEKMKEKEEEKKKKKQQQELEEPEKLKQQVQEMQSNSE